MDELVEKVEARSGTLVDWKEKYYGLLKEYNEKLGTANKIIALKNADIQSLQSARN